jgi:hypothetical protein
MTSISKQHDTGVIKIGVDKGEQLGAQGITYLPLHQQISN